MIKMVVTDLDDTLLRTDKSISPYMVETLARIRRRGIKTVFATGRGSSAKALVPLELFDACIFMNGANAFIDGKQVYDKTIPPDIARPFLQSLTGLGINAAAEIGGIHYANFEVSRKWSHIHSYGISDFSVLPGSADKLYAVIEKPEQAEAAASIVPDGLYLQTSRDNLAMIMHKEATKMNAVAAVAEQWGIAADNIAAFGDDVNDREMLAGCGFGVAMGNALEEIKAIAGYICGTNDSDGVARWLAERILQEAEHHING